MKDDIYMDYKIFDADGTTLQKEKALRVERAVAKILYFLKFKSKPKILDLIVGHLMSVDDEFKKLWGYWFKKHGK